MFLEIFNDLLDENNLSRKKFSEKSGIPYPTVIGWTNMKRLPDYTALIKIADFFGCSVDLLMGREEGYLPPAMDKDEWELLKHFRRLPPELKELIKQTASALAGKAGYTDSSTRE